MARPVTLSIDAMGGDRAPAMVIAGLNRALKRDTALELILFGDQARLNPLLARFPAVRKAAVVRHTEHVVGSGEKPSVALRTGRSSSMRLAIDAVAAGEAQGVVSAGNTGALMAMAKFVLKTLPGIARPAIAALFPSRNGETVILDLGANVDCDAENLVQFAVMGEVFARNVLGLEQPSVALLNVGEEDLKGRESVKRAAGILQASPLAFRFHGFVEGNAIAAGTVDVIVTDGFTGNVALKTAEGTAKLYSQFLKEALNGDWMARLGAMLARPALRAMRERVDPRRYDGAMLLGLNGICVKAHGGTDAMGFSNAMRVATDLITENLNDGIKHDFAKLASGEPNNSKVAAG